MPEGEQKPNIPTEVERERLHDLAWLTDNLQALWPIAQAAYTEFGRGALVTDTTIEPSDSEDVFTAYFSQAVIALFDIEDASRMVAQYEPESQFVTVLFKAEGRVSTYRLGVPNQ
ncbi:MAG: hypothetical protein IT328_23455 [Caldilineaceae bacterium]|nr:hypothetical protein [Caldilineaceae bacterium]